METSNKRLFILALNTLCFPALYFLLTPQPAAAVGYCNPELATCSLNMICSDDLSYSIEPESLEIETSLADQSAPTLISVPVIESFEPKAVPDTTQTIGTGQPVKEELDAELIFLLINEHRVTKGLTPFRMDGHLCQIAAVRAPELYNEIYVTKNMHAGFRVRDLPYRMSENIISIRNEQAAISWWLNSPVHRRGIESDNTHSCVMCHGRSCVQLFSKLEPPAGHLPTAIPSVPPIADSQIQISQLSGDPVPEYQVMTPTLPSAE